MPCDVSRREQVDAAVRTVVDALGGVDILVNAAISGAPKVPLMETDDDLMLDLFRSGPMGTLYFMQASYEQLRERKGSVINFGSGAALEVRDLRRVRAGQRRRPCALQGRSTGMGPRWHPREHHLPAANSPLQQHWAELEPEITEVTIRARRCAASETARGTSVGRRCSWPATSPTTSLVRP